MRNEGSRDNIFILIFEIARGRLEIVYGVLKRFIVLVRGLRDLMPRFL